MTSVGPIKRVKSTQGCGPTNYLSTNFMFSSDSRPSWSGKTEISCSSYTPTVGACAPRQRIDSVKSIILPTTTTGRSAASRPLSKHPTGTVGRINYDKGHMY